MRAERTIRPQLRLKKGACCVFVKEVAREDSHDSIVSVLSGSVKCIIHVVFDDEPKAYEGSRALNQLDAEGSITIHAKAVIGKSRQGSVAVLQTNDDFPVRTVGGTAIGSLIGLLGGPVGLGIGMAAGMLAGSIGDLNVAGVDAEYVDDVAAALMPGKCAVVADISEEWVTPVDTRMEALGGAVIRAARKSVEDDQRAREVAEIRADIDRLKTEHTQARAERKAKIQERIDKLEAKLQARLDAAKKRSAQIKSDADAKVQALHRKAEKAQGEVKATLDARAKRIREAHEQSEAKLKHALAGHLSAAAASLEK